MEMKDIRALAEILEESGLTSLEFDDGKSKIKLEKNPGAGTQTVFVNGTAGGAGMGVSGLAGAGALPAAPEAGGLQAAAHAAGNASSTAEGEEVKSPMVGVFYAGPSPEEGPYVSVGSQVKKGDPLCIIEAMKLMNEISAERDGVITEVCVPNGQLVEYGQTLFRIK